MKNCLIVLYIFMFCLFYYKGVYALECDSHQLTDEFATDLYFTNGNEFLTSKEKIHLILWRYIDPVEKNANSFLLSSKIGENKWEKKVIPGKAYFLDCLDNNKQICSIEKENDIWKISLYSLDGTKVKEIIHNYPKQRREIFQNVPIPLVCPDGSIIFYIRYCYDFRNPALSFILNLLSAGHGSVPRMSDYVEIIPEFFKKRAENNKEFAYVKLIDSSRRITVFGFDPKKMDSLKNFIITENDFRGYKVFELYKEGICQSYYKKGNTLVALGGQIIVEDDLFHTITTADKPSFLPTCSELGGPGGDKSDIQITEDSKIVLVTSTEGICIYDPKSKEWKTLKSPIAREYITDLRTYACDEYIYVGMWFLDKFVVTMCENFETGSPIRRVDLEDR